MKIIQINQPVAHYKIWDKSQALKPKKISTPLYCSTQANLYPIFEWLAKSESKNDLKCRDLLQETVRARVNSTLKNEESKTDWTNVGLASSSNFKPADDVNCISNVKLSDIKVYKSQQRIGSSRIMPTVGFIFSLSSSGVSTVLA